MATPSSRSSAPLLMGAVAIVLIAVGVLWMLDTEPATEPGAAIPAVVDEAAPDTELPAEESMDLPVGIDRVPEPLTTEKTQNRPELDESLWDEPLVVTGWVEDPLQKRLPDVEVNLFDDLGEYIDSQFTDASGEFRFYSDVGLPPGWSLGTEPELVDPDDPAALVPAFYTHPFPVFPGKPPVQAKLIMGRPPRIEGKVYDAATGAPIELADVEVVCMSPAWEAEFQDDYTDEAGFFGMNIVDVPARDLILRVADDEGRYAIIGPMTLQPGEVKVIDVGLTDPLTLEGTVVSAADGSPVPGAEVVVLPPHLEFEGTDAWDISGDDGEWFIDDIGTPPDRVWLLVAEDDYGPALMKVEDITRSVEVRLGEQVTVTGTITDAETGEPVPDAVVRLILAGPSGLLDDYEDMEFSEEDGTFSIPLETCPARGAIVIVEGDEHMKFRMPLRDLAPTELDLRDYDISITLAPLPAW